MEGIIDSMPCGYLAFSDDGIVLRTNRTLMQMLGRDELSLEGQHVETILTVASRIFYQTHFYPLLKMSGVAEEVYLSLRTADKGELPVLVNGSRSDRGGAMVNDCVIVPMRRRSQFEDEILRAKKALEEANREKDQANAELELAKLSLERKQRELQDRNCELEGLREQLEVQVQLRTRELRLALEDLESFSYAVAHDLRAPLRGIISSSEILCTEAGEVLSESHLELLRRQSFNGKKLATLIDDLLRFARLGREGILRVPLNLSETASDVIGSFIPAPHLRQFAFSVQPGMRVFGDPALVRIVLENLLDNAVKYSPAGGEVRVGMEERGTSPVFFVRDQGIGFEMTLAPKVFVPFERLTSDPAFDGSGIGLATVKRIIDRHEGEIWVESTPGLGTTFFFTLGEGNAGGG